MVDDREPGEDAVDTDDDLAVSHASRPTATGFVAAALGDPPAEVCRSGCERLASCADELELDETGAPDRLDRCRRECARLDPTRREGLAQSRACLRRESCEAYAACLREPDGAPRVAVVRPRGDGLTRCERICGAYADCGARTDRASIDAAAGLEMRCLDTCLVALGPAAPVSAGEASLEDDLVALESSRWCDELIGGVQAFGRRVSGASAAGSEAATIGDVSGMACEVVCDRFVGCMKEWTDGELEERELQRTRTTCIQSMCAPAAPRREVERLRSCVEFSECSDVLGCLARSGRNP